MLIDADPEEKYICIIVANRGRRSITIQNVGLELKDHEDFYLQVGSIQKGPKEVAEGKAETYTMKQSRLDLSRFKGAIAVDQTGRQWRGRLE
jgi:hypothetical protein